jgi:hypothetical protein
MPTGPCQAVALAATSVTITLAQFTTTAPYAPQAMFWNIGGAAANGHAFVAFGSTTTTVSSTNGAVIAALSQIAPVGSNNDSGMQILSTGKSPQQFMVVGSTGTTTVFVTPGEGSR